MKHYTELCELDEKLMGVGDWEDELDMLFRDYLVNNIFDLCDSAHDGELDCLVGFGRGLVRNKLNKQTINS